MNTVRHSVVALAEEGRFPSSIEAASVDNPRLDNIEKLLGEIAAPLTDTEAALLLKCFGPDSLFGLAWALVTLVESAPGWPVPELYRQNDDPGEWLDLLRKRYDNWRGRLDVPTSG